MSKPSTRILSWNRPAVDGAVDLLVEGWCGDGPLDLGGVLVLTQTKGAGRRLRFALARRAEKSGQGMFPPRFATPSVLFAPEQGKPVASEVACLLAWEQVIKDTDLSVYDSLFPKPPDGRIDSWARAVSKTLHGLRRTLSEADWDCGKVFGEKGDELQEPERWSDLAELEQAYREQLCSNGMEDPFDAKREAAGTPILPQGIGKVLALGVSGFPGLAEKALDRLVVSGVPVEVVTFGPDGERFDTLFDDWGRPVKSSWQSRPIPLVDEQLFLFPDERGQAAAMVDALVPYGDRPDGRIALGVVDSSIKPFLEQGVGDADFSFSDPEGDAAIGSSFYALLSALASLTADPSFRQAVAFLRFPETRAWLESQGASMAPRSLFEDLDKLSNKSMPVSLKDALGLASKDTRVLLGKVLELVENLRKGSFSSTMRGFLVGATADREFNSESPDDQSYLSLSPVLLETLDELEKVGGASVDSAFSLLLDVLRKNRVTHRIDPDAYAMQGWLELPWESAPRLLVAGFNEGSVPEPVPGDAFLPENLRRELGLWTSEDRFARDAYLLQWLLASRRESGRVDVLLGKWRSNGDPLKPSRLLFLCDSSDETALPARAQHLFQESVSTEGNPAWRFAWRLDPGAVVPATRLSVTDFASFLDCPYRFHLKKNLKMRTFDPAKKEWDAMDFGNAVHHVLDKFFQREEIRLSDDAGLIRAFFREELDRWFGRKFGSSPGLPLAQQKNTVFRRLSRAAEVQAKERSLGWEPIAAEHDLDAVLDGVHVRGRVDRIDRREDTGELRVLDYKTSSKLPQEAHWAPVGPDPETYPPYCRFELIRPRGKPLTRRWTNLQLPLYRWWAENHSTYAGQEVSVGYFLLPAEEEDVGVYLWPELDSERMDSAIACAQGVVADLKSGWTGSPRSRVTFDDFEELFFHDAGKAALPLGAERGSS